MDLTNDDFYNKDYFFYKKNSNKHNGFDSYSKNTEDILIHYYDKFNEISFDLKCKHPIKADKFYAIIKSINNIKLESYKPFEVYTIAFLCAMSSKYNESINCFNLCLHKLDKNKHEYQVNKVFIMLQMAQLHERIHQYKESLSILLKVYKTIKYNNVLFETIHAFYASCCISIGLIYFRIYKKNTIAGWLYVKSLIIRKLYANTYPELVYKNYISSAYRYYALTLMPKKESYYFFKESFEIKYYILISTTDEYSKKEFIHLSYDFINYLINNRYNVSYVNKISNKMYLAISNLNKNSTIEINFELCNITLMLSKYYYYLNNIYKFYKWYSLFKHFKNNKNISFEKDFKLGEDVYSLIK